MSLFDGQKGEKDNYKLGNWLATRGSPFEVCVDLGEDPPKMGQLVVSYLRNINSYIFPPVEVTLLGGDDPAKLKPVQSLRTEIPTDYSPNRVEAMTFTIPSGPYRFYKVIAKPRMKLPSWHRGAGESAWLFIDELLFYPERGPQGENER